MQRTIIKERTDPARESYEPENEPQADDKRLKGREKPIKWDAKRPSKAGPRAEHDDSAQD